MNDNLFRGLVSILPTIYFYFGTEALFMSAGPTLLTVVFAITTLYFALNVLAGFAWATNDHFNGEELW